MGRYDNEEYGNTSVSARQRDVTLASNEYCLVQSRTNGVIKTHTGPLTITISGQESLVTFNSKSKRFEETTDFEKARQLFTSAPEGWYAVLKNPTVDNTHPETAKAMGSPELQIGRKVNIAGPCSFSLFPGQMAKVVQGHRLRSNQYLLARVYDADAAEKSTATIVDAEGKEVQTRKEKYFVGQLLVIKGTEVSFYMPPTGIEVIADGKNYVRDAVTLERLEYAILKDEDGEKTYHHGPAVVFPNPTETFVESPKGGVIFRALELSPISGIYLKVIADYIEDDKEYHTGDELFITGNDQMIYYPRPEQALIQYDGKYMHHAIAIPEGEGRYILNRLTGEIKTVVGPAMYLPDPRKEVVVKRKLSAKECELFYPGNTEAFTYNMNLNERDMEKKANKGMLKATCDDIVNMAYSTASSAIDSLAIFEANANISRGTSYTKPRTITLDTKYDGVVSIDVWSGYAICVVSKTGNREIVVGPQTRLLDYDETLEVIKGADGRETVFLSLDNNKISDILEVETKDNVLAKIAVSYGINFVGEDLKKWFSIYDYPAYIIRDIHNRLKMAFKRKTIQEVYNSYMDIVFDTLYPNGSGITFDRNNSAICFVDIERFQVDAKFDKTISAYNEEAIKTNFKLANAKAQEEVIKALAENEKMKAELEYANRVHSLELENNLSLERFNNDEAIKELERESAMAQAQAKSDMQEILNAIAEEENKRVQAANDLKIAKVKAEVEIEEAKQKAYAETVKEIMGAVSPDLVAALTAKANADILTEGMRSMAPYALAQNEEISTTVNRLLRGTPLEDVLTKIQQ